MFAAGSRVAIADEFAAWNASWVNTTLTVEFPPGSGISSTQGKAAVVANQVFPKSRTDGYRNKRNQAGVHWQVLNEIIHTFDPGWPKCPGFVLYILAEGIFNKTNNKDIIVTTNWKRNSNKLR